MLPYERHRDQTRLKNLCSARRNITDETKDVRGEMDRLALGLAILCVAQLDKILGQSWQMELRNDRPTPREGSHVLLSSIGETFPLESARS